MATYHELLALEKVRRMVGEFDIAAREIYGAGRGRKRQPVRAKYRDPATGATWSGRGRPPAWIGGKDRVPFEVDPTGRPS